MAITTKNRKDLKTNFVKNAIPTEQNFADLVDAQINQADDGVFKLAGEPFSVVAAGGDQKRTLRLYANYPQANPDWLISLNPAQDPANAATNRAGFGITDGAGNTRLFLDATGKLGLGTNEPAGNLDVRLPAGTGNWNRFVVTTTSEWGDAGIQYATIGSGGATGIMLSNPHVTWRDGRASIRYGRTGGTAGNTFWDVGVRTDGSFGFIASDGGGGGEQVKISKAGQLSAGAGLNVQGAAGVGHIELDGALYRNTDLQVYLTVDDNLFIRDMGAATWAAQFETNTGGLNLKGRLTTGAGLRATSNGAVIDVEGTDHGYIQFMPRTLAGGRKGWIGYGVANTNTLSITNEAGDLSLTGTSLYIRDVGAATWTAQFETNTGGLNLKGRLTTGAGLRATSNGAVIDLEGTDHGYIQFMPRTLAGGRKGWIGYGAANTNTLSVTSEAGDLALVGTSVNITGFTQARGLAVNDSTNTGVARGLYLWAGTDSNHVIYSANQSGKSPNDKTPATGFHNAGHRMRFRTFAEGQGFLFENHNETALVDIASDTGNFWSRGRATLGGGLTVPKGQPVAGVPVTVLRTITLKPNTNGWAKPVPGQWTWDWTETYDVPVTGAWAVIAGTYFNWSRNEPLRAQVANAVVASTSGNTARINVQFGWLDFTGNWDDELASDCYMRVVVIVQLSAAV
ncbi:hypothetical protein ACNOYE_14570 [Nannocystaceae bacterium ST9]